MKISTLGSCALLLSLIACTSKDGEDSSAPDVNEPPTADAGVDITQYADEVVNLDGSASFDPDGDAIAYYWSFEHVPEGSTLESATAFSSNDGASAMSTSFVPDMVGTYVVGLYVTDGPLNSAVDYVVVTAETPTTLPVADAGADISVGEGDTISLDGSASYDPRGYDITYAWSTVDVPSSSVLTTGGITGADSAGASFTADVRGVYVLNLVVDNGLVSSLADAVVITVTGDDDSPTANAGEDIDSEDCTHITLDGSGSTDPDGDAMDYYWEVQSIPSGSAVTNDSFSDRNVESPSFFGDIAGIYVLSVTVFDGTSWSLPDSITLALAERAVNSAPVISIPAFATIAAGDVCCEESGYTYDCEECDDQSMVLGDTVTIVDADGDPYTLVWEMVSGDGELVDPNSLVTDIKLEDVEATEPAVCDANEYEFVLTVTDCTGAVTSATAALTAECCGLDASDETSGCDE